MEKKKLICTKSHHTILNKNSNISKRAGMNDVLKTEKLYKE